MAVPDALPEADIRSLLKEKELWLYRTLAQKREALGETRPREYVSGEGFYYLGKSYRLKLVDGEGAQFPAKPLRPTQGRFLLDRRLAGRGRELFIEWYSRHAARWIETRSADLARRVGANPSGFRVMDLGFRWGSCGKGGQLNINWRTILLPPDLVGYVLIHELVHLIERSHSPAFYDHLRCACPEFEAHEIWLKENGNGYGL
jgi:hypothetical protein